MESAKKIKEKGGGSSVLELSVVDVPVGTVGLLSLSPDSSTLAASVGGTVNFFSINSLLNKVSSESLLLDHAVRLHENMAEPLGPEFLFQLRFLHVEILKKC